MPTYTFATGVSPATATWNTVVRDQVVTTCTSATRPTGTAGQVIFETDTGRYMVYTGTAWLEFGRVSGNQTWTPQIDQGATTNIAKTGTPRFVQRGNEATCWGTLAVTGAGTAGSPVSLTLPISSSGYATNDQLGYGHIIDASAGGNSSFCSAWYNGSGAVIFQIDSTAAAGRWGQAPSIALASGDSIRFSLSYLTA